MKYYLVFLIGIVLFFLIYFIVSLCRGEVDYMPALLFLILIICGIGDLIMASIGNIMMRYITVIVFAFLIFIILLASTDCGSENTHVLISGLGLLICLCYFACWLIDASGIFFYTYFLLFAFSSLIVFTVYFFMSLCKGDMDTVAGCAGVVYSLCVILEVILLCIDFEVVRFVLIYLVGLIVAIILIANCECLRDIWPLSIILLIVMFFGCSYLCMQVGGDDNETIVGLYSLSQAGMALILVCCILGCCASNSD